MTIRELLHSLAPCPVPDDYINAIGAEIGQEDMDANLADTEVKSVYRAEARLYIYLATVPNVSEGGVSISFTATEKKAFLDLARRYANLAGETGLVPGATYGYKGQNI